MTHNSLNVKWSCTHHLRNIWKQNLITDATSERDQLREEDRDNLSLVEEMTDCLAKLSHDPLLKRSIKNDFSTGLGSNYPTTNILVCASSCPSTGLTQYFSPRMSSPNLGTHEIWAKFSIRIIELGECEWQVRGENTESYFVILFISLHIDKSSQMWRPCS
jgi:hypothetical protein